MQNYFVSVTKRTRWNWNCPPNSSLFTKHYLHLGINYRMLRLYLPIQSGFLICCSWSRMSEKKQHMDEKNEFLENFFHLSETSLTFKGKACINQNPQKSEERFSYMQWVSRLWTQFIIQTSLFENVGGRLNSKIHFFIFFYRLGKLWWK
jgi:hypothetical protein